MEVEPDNPFVIKTFTGRLVDPFYLTPEDVDIVDIAVALRHINRFNGHTCQPMPVDVHCVEVAEIIEDSGSSYYMEGLLHDASEAYLCDIPSPIKRRPEMAEYREAEERAQVAIAERYGLVYPWPEVVHLADAAAYKRDRERRFTHDRHYIPKGDFLSTFLRLGGAI